MVHPRGDGVVQRRGNKGRGSYQKLSLSKCQAGAWEATAVSFFKLLSLFVSRAGTQ